MSLNNRSSFFSYIHGDLRDLIKLENDLLYIYTPMNSDEDLKEALLFSDMLFKVRDLAQALKPVEETRLTRPGFIRTYKTLQVLRSYYPALIEHDRDPLQLVIGQLRYSLHTLSFLESNHYHKLWALYNSGYFGQQIKKRILSGGLLRINWIDHKVISPGSIGLAILPGRKDYSRSIDEDLKQLKEYGIDTIIPLLTDDEFFQAGLPSSVASMARHDGYLFVGEVNGLKRLHSATRTFRFIECPLTQVFSLLQVADELLATGANEGVYRIVGDRVVPVRASISSDYRAVSLHQWSRNPNIVVVGLTDGLALLRRGPEGWIDEGRVPDLGIDAWTIAEASNGELWLGSESSYVVRIRIPEKGTGLS